MIIMPSEMLEERRRQAHNFTPIEIEWIDREDDGACGCTQAESSLKEKDYDYRMINVEPL